MKKQQNIPAAYLYLMDGSKTLLLRRFNTGYEDGNYSLIAGHVEANESFSQCIIREAKEEAGIDILLEDLKVVHMMHRNSGYEKNNERIEVFFTAKKWMGTITNKEPHKCDDLSWFDFGNLPSNMIPYIKKAIRSIGEKITYSEFGW